MQWLIDLIIEAIGIPPVYVDRGLPHPPDFIETDLTYDGSWHTLDFSGVVPEGASAINIQIKAKSDAVGKVLKVRKDSTAVTLNTCVARFVVANVTDNFPIVCGLTAARTLDYNITAGNYADFDWRTRGWWL